MARLNYFDIVLAIKNILLEDEDLQNYHGTGVRVIIGDKLNGALPESAPCIILEKRVRAAPADTQRISAGTITVFDIQITALCVEFDLSSIEDAHRRLDELISYTELAIMRDRSLRGTVDHCRLDGGRFDSLSEGNHFIVGAEVNVFVRAKTSY